MTTSSTGTGALTLVAVSGYPTFDQLLASGALWAAGTYQVWYDIIDETNGLFEAGIGSYVTSTKVLTRTLPQHTYTGTTYDATSPSALNFASNTNVVVMMSPLSTMGGGLAFPGTGNVSGAMGGSTAGGIASSVARGNASIVVTADREYYIPFLWLGSNQIDQVATRTITAATTGNMKSAWYEMLASGAPGAKLKDFGAGAIGGAGVNFALAVTNFAPPPGWYFYACVFDAAVQPVNIRSAIPPPLGCDATINPLASYFRTGSYSTGLPDPGSVASPTAQQLLWATDVNVPFLSFRMA